MEEEVLPFPSDAPEGLWEHQLVGTSPGYLLGRW